MYNRPMDWKERARALLEQSLYPVRQELNDLDWKQDLSPKIDRIHEHISALANYPRGGFLVFGVDRDGNKIGIQKDKAPQILDRLTSIARDGILPACQIDHCFEPATNQENVLLFIFIPETSSRPAHIKGRTIEESYIRSGGTTRKMSMVELREAMRSSNQERFEETPLIFPGAEKILTQIDVEAACETMGTICPKEAARRTEKMVDLRFATKTPKGVLPTYLGVLVAANSFKNIPGCEHYAIRVTKYKGPGKIEAEQDRFFYEGYQTSIDKALRYVVSLLPSSEIIEEAARKQVCLYPIVALRELIANAVVHRDYNNTGSYVHIQIFEGRIEITNPGTLLPDMKIDRLIDQEPRARNEVLAQRLRELKLCEERGSGIDRVIQNLEIFGLPAVEFQNTPTSFTAIIFAPKPYKRLSWSERLNVAYQHTALHHVFQQNVTNASFRKRFKLTDSQSQAASELIRRSIAKGLIKQANPGASPRYVHYVPYYA